MKLLVLSDLHLEFAPFSAAEPVVDDCDVIILAGDIDKGTAALPWAYQTFGGKKPVLYVAGNHEFYDHEWTDLLAHLRTQAPLWSVNFLENTELVIEGVRFLGCTLWTDFEFFGADSVDASMARAERALNDHRLISNGPGPLRASDVKKRHLESRRWLEARLAELHQGKTVVITHHLPSARSVAPRYQDDSITPAFASELSHLARKSDLWIHGHTHDSYDYELVRSDGSTCRVVCNPRGYPGFRRRPGGSSIDWMPEFENKQFNPALLVNI